MPPFRIRDAVAADAQAIAGLLALIDHSTAVERIPERLLAVREAPGRTLVAELEGMVVGLVTMHRVDMLHREGPVAFLNALVVHPDHRGHGIGRALVDAVNAQGRAWGCLTVELTSRDDRLDAHQFYARLGFESRSRKFARPIS